MLKILILPKDQYDRDLNARFNRTDFNSYDEAVEYIMDEIKKYNLGCQISDFEFVNI